MGKSRDKCWFDGFCLWNMVIQWVFNGKPLISGGPTGKIIYSWQFLIAIFDYQISKPRKGWILWAKEMTSGFLKKQIWQSALSNQTPTCCCCFKIINIAQLSPALQSLYNLFAGTAPYLDIAGIPRNYFTATMNNDGRWVYPWLEKSHLIFHC
jgi:hypothetical protein